MTLLLPLLIVAVAPDPPLAARFPEAATVLYCTFDAAWDQNFDQWPDGWTRRRGPGFPHYVGIRLDPEPSPQGDGCLRIDLDGGAAAAYSPPVEIDADSAYVLEGYLKTDGLEHDRAYLSIILLDEDRQRLETFYSEKFRQVPLWQKIRLGPIAPASHDARLAIVGLHLQPQSGADLKGTAMFGDVWLGRIPRLELGTTAGNRFFDQTEQIRLDCTATGLTDLESSPRVTLQLEDVLGRELARLEQPLHAGGLSQFSQGGGLSQFSQGENGTVPFRLASLHPEEDSPADASPQPPPGIAKTTWQPPIPGPGFYRVRATMEGRQGLVLRQELSLAVFDRQQTPVGGEFGWTLPQGDRPMPLPLLGQLIAQAGINWVKYPLWYDERRGEESIEGLITFGEQLGRQGIELVGLLNEPPRSEPAEDGPSHVRSAADLFTDDVKVWYPSLEPVISRLATRVGWWQLGDDKDASFVDCPNLPGKIAKVKAELDRIGRDVNLGFGWGWLDEPPPGTDKEVPWRFLALSADPPLTHEELAAYLDASRQCKLRRWVVVEPLPKDGYPIEVRAADLVRRMIAAKIHGADAIFCPEPFSTQRGLLDDDGNPGELLFAWRTAARTLGGATYLGSLQLPGGSPNQIFSRGDDVVMVVWNPRPTEEVIYLGEDVRQIDLWGRSQQPSQQGNCQVIHAGPLPSFVTGINEPITRWRLDFALAEERIPSVSNLPHQNSLRLVNHFPRGVVGRVTLVTPESWKVTPQQTTFWLAEGEPFEQDFQVTLPHDADSGRQPIRADVELEAERPYRFSVYRQIEVGLGDVSVEILTRLNERGELEVRQRLVNQSPGPVSFRCELFAPHRRREQTQVVDLRPGRDEQVYLLADGRELIGETLWLRAEEIRGPRILNYRFPAEP